MAAQKQFRITEETGGVKHDTDKLRYDLVPPKALEKIVAVFTYGAGKYGDRNWEKGIAISRLYAAAQRHLNDFWAGQDLDEESVLEHLAHAATDILMMIELRCTKPETDDRP